MPTRAVRVDSHDPCSPRHALFTAPLGVQELPRLRLTPDVTGSTVVVERERVQSVVVHRTADGRVLSSEQPVDVSISSVSTTALVLDAEPVGVRRAAGVRLEVFVSGSDGLTPVRPLRDLHDDLSFGLDLRLLTDDEIDALLSSRLVRR